MNAWLILMLLCRYADKHLMSCVCRFYAVEGEISNLALTVETWKGGKK